MSEGYLSPLLNTIQYNTIQYNTKTLAYVTVATKEDTTEASTRPKKISAYYESRKTVALFTTARHRSASSAKSTPFTLSQQMYLKTLCSHERLGRPLFQYDIRVKANTEHKTTHTRCCFEAQWPYRDPQGRALVVSKQFHQQWLNWPWTSDLAPTDFGLQYDARLIYTNQQILTKLSTVNPTSSKEYTILLTKLTVTQLVNKLSVFQRTRSPSACSQKPATESYQEPHKSCPLPGSGRGLIQGTILVTFWRH
jgi:hypothetical protein